MLEAARRADVARFHHISTCEVYGDMDLDDPGAFTEESPYRPRTPYNAAKAGGDHAVRAYYETFEVPVTITNCSNNYGPYQFPEKVIPVFATKAIDDQPHPAVQVDAEPPRVAARARPLQRDRDRARSAAGSARPTTSARASRSRIEEIADAVLGAPRQAGLAEDDRAGPPRPRPSLPPRHAPRSAPSSAGRPRSSSRRDRRHRPLVRRAPRRGGSRCATARPSSKRTGARLADAGPRDRRAGPGRHRPR